MSPAVTLAWFVVGGSLVSIILTETASVARASATSFGAWSPSFGRFSATVGVAFLVVSLLRPQSSVAATPPPSDRIVFMATEADRAVAALAPAVGLLDSSPVEDSSPYTVVRGDSLWAIARSHIAARGIVPSGTDVATFWRAIFVANRSVIGNDPNLILPGQVLTIPGCPCG